MAVRTVTQLKANIASQLADNTSGDISEADIRNNLIDIIDSLQDGINNAGGGGGGIPSMFVELTIDTNWFLSSSSSGSAANTLYAEDISYNGDSTAHAWKLNLGSETRNEITGGSINSQEELVLPAGTFWIDYAWYAPFDSVNTTSAQTIIMEGYDGTNWGVLKASSPRNFNSSYTGFSSRFVPFVLNHYVTLAAQTRLRFLLVENSASDSIMIPGLAFTDDSPLSILKVYEE